MSFMRITAERVRIPSRLGFWNVKRDWGCSTPTHIYFIKWPVNLHLSRFCFCFMFSMLKEILFWNLGMNIYFLLKCICLPWQHNNEVFNIIYSCIQHFGVCLTVWQKVDGNWLLKLWLFKDLPPFRNSRRLETIWASITNHQ